MSHPTSPEAIGGMSASEAVAFAREVVQQAANLSSEPRDEEDALDVRPDELEAIVLRVLREFGLR